MTPAGGRLLRLDHVQLAMPPGEEARAEAFYCGVLGLEVMEKPTALAGRGGRWFASPDGELQLHLGCEEDFRAAKKAHPAVAVDGLDEMAARLERAGCPVRFDDDLGGVRRFFTEDPFGNRIELLAAS